MRSGRGVGGGGVLGEEEADGGGVVGCRGKGELSRWKKYLSSSGRFHPFHLGFLGQHGKFSLKCFQSNYCHIKI
jgi:hypothetical protein